MPPQEDDAPSTTMQLARIKTITQDIDAVHDQLDDIGEQLQDLLGDDYSLAEPQRMPHMESIDLQRAREDAERGIRAMRRILDQHASNLKSQPPDTGDYSKRAHLSAVRSTGCTCPTT